MNPILQQMQQMSPQTASPTAQPAPMIPSNPMQMLQRFREFRQAMAGRNPQAMVQALLNNGQMSPQQFEALKAQAMQMAQLMK